VTADEMYDVLKRLRAAESARPKTRCPKCGKATLEAKMSPEAAADMAAAGYDGTCCWEGFDVEA
jgi:uncharacterized protein with PIN domain